MLDNPKFDKADTVSFSLSLWILTTFFPSVNLYWAFTVRQASLPSSKLFHL